MLPASRLSLLSTAAGVRRALPWCGTRGSPPPYVTGRWAAAAPEKAVCAPPGGCPARVDPDALAGRRGATAHR
eukprot:gene52626-50374_t